MNKKEVLAWLGCLKSDIKRLQAGEGDGDTCEGAFYAIEKVVEYVEKSYDPLREASLANVKDISAILDMARAFQDDIRSGLEDGTYDHESNPNFEANEKSLRAVDAWLIEVGS